MASSFPLRAAIAALTGVVGFGRTDIVAHILAPPLSEALGQPVVIENKKDASGVGGADFVAKSANDAGPSVNVTSPVGFGKYLAGEISRWRLVRDKACLQPAVGDCF